MKGIFSALIDKAQFLHRRIVIALLRTMELMTAIDETIPDWPLR